MTHKRHLFKKISQKTIIINQGESMKQIFGPLPPLPKGKKWDEIQQEEIVYKCKCGAEMKFVDLPGGEYIKKLGNKFYAPNHKPL